ncbi:MAG TPA: hypothetical protein ENK99_04030 [Campylobacterales bacterium]|nr:hypothetical protein [Arcobacter sp.]HHD80757.1 hypothetical protein [Campylobacterales bacterium]HHH54072.1 hypothetical protein [Bacteroidota bacterium]
MDRTWLNNVKRFIIIFLIQILILKRIDFFIEDFHYIQFFLYPLFILLLPLKMQRPLILLIAFFSGLILDIFYDSPGLHASSLTFMVFIRNYILKFLEPREGYNVDSSPTIANFGFSWFLIYSSILLFLNLFWYFSVESFTFQYFSDIILKTIFSFIFSEVLILLYVVILNPK